MMSHASRIRRRLDSRRLYPASLSACRYLPAPEYSARGARCAPVTICGRFFVLGSACFAFILEMSVWNSSSAKELRERRFQRNCVLREHNTSCHTGPSALYETSATCVYKRRSLESERFCRFGFLLDPLSLDLVDA